MGSSSSDSDETDEEERKKLQESVSGATFETSVEKTALGSRPLSKKKSLRAFQHEGAEGDNILQTTPEFRKFVAAKLEQYLEREITEKDLTTKATAIQEADDQMESGEIKLLRTSCFPVNEKPVCSDTKEVMKKRRKDASISSSSQAKSNVNIPKFEEPCVETSEDDLIEIEKLRSAAVTMEFVNTEAETYRKFQKEYPDKITVIRSEVKSKKKKKKTSETQISL